MTTKRVIRKQHGFTLLESLFAAMLIGLVITALIASSAAFTMANAAGVDLSTAEFLIEEIREKKATMEFADIGIGDTGTYQRVTHYTTPIDMNGDELVDFDSFTQVVIVDPVSGTDFEPIADLTSDFKKITVRIRKNGQTITEASWLRANLD